MATMSIRELFVSLVVRDRASKAVRKTNKEMDRAKNVMRKATRETKRVREEQGRLKKSTVGLGSAWRTLAGIAGVGLVLNQFRKLGTESISLAIDFEQTEISFATLMGSVAKGNKMLQELEEFSLVTPFEPDPIIRAGKVLLAAQRPAQGITDDLRRLGDVAAISGVPIQDLTKIFSKVFSKGKAQTEELLQVAERGIPILSVLAEVMGVETTEQILKMGEQGEITFEKFNEAFTLMTSQGGAFEDGMKRLSRTAGGLISTLVGFQKILKRTFGKAALEPLKDLTRELIAMSKALLEWLAVAENIQMVKDAFVGLGKVLELTLKVLAALGRLTGKTISTAQAHPEATMNLLDLIAASGRLKPAFDLGKALVLAGRKQPEARADGGPVTTGKSFLVGEEGPELFTPRSSGMVSPMGEGGLSLSFPNMTVRANDAAGGRRAAQAFMDALNQLAPQIRLEAGLQWAR